MAHISVIGAGYVGLVTGACMAEIGHHVTCIEIDQRRLSMLRDGRVPIHEPGLDELVGRHLASGRIRFTDDYGAAVPQTDVVFVAVNTPPGPEGRADTTQVFTAVRSVVEHAAPGLVLVLKSTVPVGTGVEVTRQLEELNRPDIDVVSNPEFLRQGSAVKDFLQPDRIVIGADTPAAAERVAALYEGFNAPVIITSRPSAELAKYAANALLATKISFMNEVAAVCEAAGADVEDIARVVGLDRRIGPAFLSAGLGWGGSCLPKDVRALAATAEDFGCRTALLDAVSNTNNRQRQRAFEILRAAVSRNERPVVAVLGLAFKPNTDDIREAPALDVIARLLEEGIRVRAHDPKAMANARLALPNITYCDDAYDAARDAGALLLATEWRDYLTLDWSRMRTLMRGDLLLDGRNVLDGRLLNALGFMYVSFGRTMAGPRPPSPAPRGDGARSAGVLT